MSRDPRRNTNTPQIIKKEDIPNLTFTNMDVLDDEKEKFQRLVDLKRATALGNTEKTKVKIFFRANQGVFRVHTTIWATTDKSVTFKGGVIIPIYSILRVI